MKKTTRTTPRSWRPSPELETKIQSALRRSGLEFSELAEIAVGALLSKAKTPSDLIDIKLAWLRDRNER